MTNLLGEYLTDEKLLDDIKAHVPDSFKVLYGRYLPLIRKMKRQYYFQDVDDEDWEQEARVVMWRTIRSYNKSRGVAFCYFFKLNLRNHAYDLIRHENAAKRIKVDQRINIDHESFTDELADPGSCPPDDWTICQESIHEFLSTCSKFERRIFALIHQGCNAQEVADQLECDVRKVTSALDRCRKKLNELFG
ncbi:MAG: sigma-70 family RNA polymerase sigma factor [Lactobacillus sp.]|jgi:RNA polymerase sporulation-specific sigma factor|nr:MAG: sigma-70 family RNA polymerase sigma factor [Lactobacillus sp.]